MKYIATVRNMPSYAAKYKYIVARFADGELWFFGAYDDADRAGEVAADNGGLVLRQEA